MERKGNPLSDNQAHALDQSSTKNDFRLQPNTGKSSRTLSSGVHMITRKGVGCSKHEEKKLSNHQTGKMDCQAIKAILQNSSSGLHFTQFCKTQKRQLMNDESNQEGHVSRSEGSSRIAETQESTRLCTCGRPQDECSDQVTLGYPITMPVTGVPMQSLNQPPSYHPYSDRSAMQPPIPLRFYTDLEGGARQPPVHNLPFRHDSIDRLDRC
uniref:AlNc14C568G12168 protein n=1 Tax=Albugo laibachii Nc14 TaxID=890382 RepID=F0X174_9STRA|nr:AlNc14C568G12168 [Albugo laibachii Nc14]|eukprot:CCA27532.1 AlNc14C568G12168 [Albugo laibachii Nc14]